MLAKKNGEIATKLHMEEFRQRRAAVAKAAEAKRNEEAIAAQEALWRAHLGHGQGFGSSRKLYYGEKGGVFYVTKSGYKKYVK